MAEPSLNSLDRRLPALRQRASVYEPTRALAIAAGLQLIPDLQPNLVRLEVLVTAIAGFCHGVRKADARNVASILNLLDPHFAHLEDPIEDALSAIVPTPLGNRTALLGRWHFPEYWLQQSLFALSPLREQPEVTDLVTSIDCLLRLAQLVLDRAGIDPETQGDGHPAEKPLRLPDWATMEEAADWTTIRPGDLAELGIPPQRLEPFILGGGDMESICTKAFDYTPLHQKPLYRSGENLIMAMPTSIARAGRLAILRVIGQIRREFDFGQTLAEAQTQELDLIRTKLKGRGQSISFDDPTAPRAPTIEAVCLFDRDKACLVVTVLGRPPSEPSAADEELVGTMEMSAAVNRRIQWCLAQVAKATVIQGGLVILSAGGGGGGLQLEMEKLPPGWHYFSTSLPDLHALSTGDDASFMRLWRMTVDRDDLRSQRVKIMNMSDDHNLFCHWQNLGYSILPHEKEGKRLSGLLIDSATYFQSRRKGRLKRGLHVTWHPSAREWLRIEHYHTNAFFDHLRHEPFYVDSLSAPTGLLRACMESDRGICWIEATLPSDRERPPILFEIWKCVAHWTLKVLDLRPTQASGSSVPRLIRIELAEEEWNRTAITKDLNDRGPLEFTNGPEKGVLLLRISVRYLRAFANPVNIAERQLVEILLRFLHGDGSALLSAADSNLVVHGDHERVFHLIPRRDTLHFDHAGVKEPRLIPDELRAAAGRRAADMLREFTGDKPVETKDETIRASHALVDKLHTSILELLRQVTTDSIVNMCLRNNADIEADRELWYTTAAANLATNPDVVETQMVAFDREAERAAAAQTSRVLIEASLIATPDVGAQPVTYDVFERLMSLMEALILVANHSDAISYDVAAPGIRFGNNGEVEIDTTPYSDIAKPLHEAVFGGSFSAAAESYADAFHEPKAVALNPNDTDFLTAYVEEFGYSVESLAKADFFLERVALERGTRILRVDRDSLKARFVDDADIPTQEVDAMLTDLSLVPRRGFGLDLPMGTPPAEEYPWRYRRRLSVLWRPILQLGHAENPEVMVCASLFHQSARYRNYQLYAGFIPAERMLTKKMRDVIGRAADRRGHGFVSRLEQAIKTSGLQTWAERELESLGAPKVQRGWGDVDILAYDSKKRRLYALEGKSLIQVRSVSEMVAQMKQFKGDAGDDLWKHLRRVEWLTANLASVGQPLKLDPPPVAIEHFIVTAGWVPMQFGTVAAAMKDRFIHESQLLARMDAP